MLSNILERMEGDEAGSYLIEMDLRKAAQVVECMESDSALEILSQLDRDQKGNLIECMDETSQKELALMASFGEDEIGSKMTTNYISIQEDLTVKQAMSALIQQASENDNISTIFVSDQSGVFCGAIDLKELIIARPDTEFSSLIMTSYPYVYGHESIDDCIEQLKDYSEDLVPVLDNQNRLLGVITAQSIIQVVDDEMGEDYAMLAGLTAEEDLAEPLGQSMKKRLPWLFVLLALGLVVSSVVGVFEQVVSQLPLIMSFQSLILDMAGNVGTQSLAVTIRVLMDENLTARQKFGLVAKEMRIGFANGLLLGAASFGAIGLFIWAVKGKGLLASFAISGCIGASLLLAMVISSAVGTLIPLFSKNQCGSRSCFRASDHHSKRLGGGGVVLRTQLGIPSPNHAPGGMKLFHITSLQGQRDSSALTLYLEGRTVDHRYIHLFDGWDKPWFGPAFRGTWGRL